MEKQTIHIKNMVCPRCIMAVRDLLNDLNIHYHSVELGRVVLTAQLCDQKGEILKKRLDELGFQLLEPGKSSLISRIKTVIVEQIHHRNDALTVNFSAFLSGKLQHEYSYLSRLFSGVEGITIGKFITMQRIEKVKELLFYNEMTLSEIAHALHYSSVSHLSSQFRKETGMTPTQFKRSHKPGHQHLDGL